MAKKAPSETNLPLILALIFFVLATIGGGVYAYVLHDAQAEKDAKVAEVQKQLDANRKELEDAKMKVRVYRVVLGIDTKEKKATAEATSGESEPEATAPANAGTAVSTDLTVLQSQVKQGDAAAEELQSIANDIRRRAGEAHTERVTAFTEKLTKMIADNGATRDAITALVKELVGPEDLVVWEPKYDPTTKKLSNSPTGDLISRVVDSRNARNIAMRLGSEEKAEYLKTIQALDAAAKTYEAEKGILQTKIAGIPNAIDAQVTAEKKNLEARQQAYQDEINKAKQQVKTAQDENRRQANEIVSLNDQLTVLRNRLNSLSNAQSTSPSAPSAPSTPSTPTPGGPATGGTGSYAVASGDDPAKLGDPKGKILKWYKDNTVEIDLGSSDRVREGMTFSVLPSDYPQKGEMSRTVRAEVRDPRGGYKMANQFRFRAMIQVTEILGPSQSLARITWENDAIRDRVLPGDLLYNPSWHRGQVEHVALIGVFDVNAAGRDDLATVKQDLAKQGIIVDAVWDPIKPDENGDPGSWVDGRVTDRTRKAIRGYFPTPSAAGSNNTAMTELNKRFEKGRTDLRVRNIEIVNMRDYFPLMGIRIRQEISDDTIRRAAQKYADQIK